MRGAWIAMLLVVLLGATVFTGRGDGQTNQMPPGHPPLGGQGRVPAPPPGSGAGASGLTWTAPPGWTSEAPASPMRRAQYRIAGPGGPGECAVFYFGPGQGGDAKANVARWVGQFRRADGQAVTDSKTREFKVNGMTVTAVEVAGTYVGGMGGGPSGPAQPNYMLLGAVVQGPDANWFFRATGPRATMEAQRAAFDRLLRSIKPGPNA
jgi:hypothetical protein